MVGFGGLRCALRAGTVGEQLVVARSGRPEQLGDVRCVVGGLSGAW